MVTFVNEQRTAAGGGDAASIGRDPLLRQLRNSLRTELLGPHGSEAMTRLAEVGVEFTQSGTLELDTARFREAVRTDGSTSFNNRANPVHAARGTRRPANNFEVTNCA